MIKPELKLEIGDAFNAPHKTAIGRALNYFSKDRKGKTFGQYIVSCEGYGHTIYVKAYTLFGNSIGGGGFEQVVFVVEQDELHEKIDEMERMIALEDAGCE